MKNTYVFRPYKKEFPAYFRAEKRKLLALFPHAQIEHIGSTAVPGLGGKGIIDIITSVPKKEVRAAFKKLANLYVFNSSGGNDQRFFFHKEYIRKRKTRGIHLHVTHHLSKDWHIALLFRDILRTRPDIARAYATLKKKACIVAKGDGLKYRKYKNPFIKNVLDTYGK